MDYKNKCLFYNDNIYKELPYRTDFLNAASVAEVENRIMSKKPILICANNIYRYDLTGKSTDIHLVGTTSCGSKVSLILGEVDIYFDIFSYNYCMDNFLYNPQDLKVCRELNNCDHVQNSEIKQFCENNPEFAKFNDSINKFIDYLKSQEKISIKNKIYIRSKIYDIGITKNPLHLGIRIYFYKLQSMNAALRHAIGNSSYFVTSNNSKFTDYFCAKNNKLVGNYMVLSNYKIEGTVADDPLDPERYKFNLTKAKYNLYANCADFTKIDEKYSLADLGFSELPAYNSLQISLDIETANTDVAESNNIKKKYDGIKSEYNDIFNIGLAVSLESNSKKVELYISIVSSKDAIDREYLIEDALVISTRSPIENIYALKFVLAKLQPDFILTFNGLDFDIPQILLSARKYNIFDDFYSTVSLKYSDDLQNYSEQVQINKNIYAHNKGKYTYWRNVTTDETVSGLSPYQNYDGLKINKSMLNNKFKINASEAKSYHYIEFCGTMILDLYLVYWKLYAKSQERSLNFYLSKNKQKLKDDVPYYIIWYIYNLSADSKKWNTEFEGKTIYQWYYDIVKYCNYDAFAGGKLLMDIKQFMSEKRGYCIFTYLPLYNIIFRADTSKSECGLLYNTYLKKYVKIETKFNFTPYAKNEGIPEYALKNKHVKELYCNIKSEKNKGAFCEIHKRGKIYIEYKNQKFTIPIEALDFSSLYPNIAITNNLSKEIFSYINIDGLRKLETADMEGNFKNICIYNIDHCSQMENFGIIPKFLYGLYLHRVQIKKILAKHEHRMSELEFEFSETYSFDKYCCDLAKSECKNIDNDEKMQKEYRAYCVKQLMNNPEYIKAKLNHEMVDAEQLAVKITMNATYGYLDYAYGIYYYPLIPALITYYGRKYINYVNEVCLNYKKVLVYNDTDSVYFHHSIDCYADILDKSIDGELSEDQLSKKMVMRSMRLNTPIAELQKIYSAKNPAKLEFLLKLTAMDCPCTNNSVPNSVNGTFNDIINEKMLKLTGHGYLKLVREETLYPAIYFMKKKYIGKVHGRFYVGSQYTIDDNCLIRGIELRKGGAVKFVTDFFKRVLCKTLDTNLDPSEIVFEELDKLYNLEDSETIKMIDDFIGYAKYKSDKANNAAKIVGNYRYLRSCTTDETELHYLRDPMELEIVKFIITKQNRYVDLLGRNIKTNTLERAFSKDLILLYGLNIDLKHYIEKTYTSCSQMLTYKEDIAGYYPGIQMKDYVKHIKVFLKKKYKSYNDKNYEEEPEFKKKFKNITLKVFPIFAEYFRCELGDAAWLVTQMFNVSTTKYSKKINNIISSVARIRANQSLKNAKVYYNSDLLCSCLKKKVEVEEIIEKEIYVKLNYLYRIIEGRIYKYIYNTVVNIEPGKITDILDSKLKYEIIYVNYMLTLYTSLKVAIDKLSIVSASSYKNAPLL